MLITQDKQSHYCYIKSLNRLRYDQHNTGHKVFFCERCPQGFSSQNVLDNHLFYCRGIKCRPENKIEMPKKGKKYSQVRELTKPDESALDYLC